MINRIIFAAGGTGGHIYPAIAVANELKKLNPSIKILFIGAKGKLEEKIVPNSAYELKTIDVQGFYRSLNLKNVSSAIKLIKALTQSKKILKEFKPEIVFGTGGYVSGPVLKSANSLRIPTAVQEGNYYPGITVKMLAPKAEKVILNFEASQKYLKRKDNIAITGYPVRENLIKYSIEDARKYFGLDINRKTLFTFGGSQGAASINNALLNCFENLTNCNINIIWQTGERDYEKINDSVKANQSVKVFKYINDIDYAYSASDLIVCRAGISTVTELAAFGCASVLVPYPRAAENHQEKNANALVEKDAAEMLKDSMLNEKLEQKITELINDNKKLDEMKKNIKQFADIKAASKIADMLTKLVRAHKKNL